MNITERKILEQIDIYQLKRYIEERQKRKADEKWKIIKDLIMQNPHLSIRAERMGIDSCDLIDISKNQVIFSDGMEPALDELQDIRDMYDVREAHKNCIEIDAVTGEVVED